MNFFISPHPIWWILIPAALSINFMAWYDAHWFRQFGLPGKFLEFLGTRFPLLPVITNLLALIVHLGESFFAMKLCVTLNMSPNNRMKWMLQTFILGYPSLRILLNQNAPFGHRR
uniref:Transmembrane protein 254 n=1 Tax=Setaria digitata TaxID=48799 RepID=A0A915PNN6_9BILA